MRSPKVADLSIKEGDLWRYMFASGQTKPTFWKCSSQDILPTGVLIDTTQWVWRLCRGKIKAGCSRYVGGRPGVVRISWMDSIPESFTETVYLLVEKAFINLQTLLRKFGKYNNDLFYSINKLFPVWQNSELQRRDHFISLLRAVCIFIFPAYSYSLPIFTTAPS